MGHIIGLNIDAPHSSSLCLDASTFIYFYSVDADICVCIYVFVCISAVNGFLLLTVVKISGLSLHLHLFYLQLDCCRDVHLCHLHLFYVG